LCAEWATTVRACPGSAASASSRASWWWADPAAGYVLVFYAAREVREIFSIPD
jgi:hypothetical protein